MSGPSASRRSPVPGWIPDDLPRAAGVYQFETENGDVLYVGKSVNLRRRVRGYFYGGGPDDPRLAEMLRIAARVSIRRTGSDLEARLEEAERILERRPPYNRALKNRWRAWYVELPWSQPFPRLRVVRARRRTGSRYAGPFPGRRSAERVRRLLEKTFRLRTCSGSLRPDPSVSPCLQYGLGLCTAPCARRVRLRAYRSQVRAAGRLLSDPDWAAELRRRTEAARREAAERLAFEEAADLQRRLAWLEEFSELRFLLERGPAERSWLLVLPAADGERRVLVPVARGRPLRRREVAWEAGRWETAVDDACYAIAVAELQSGGTFGARELVPALIVARWLAEGAPGGVALPIDGAQSAALVERLRRRGFGE